MNNYILTECCDLLENIYLCGINNNLAADGKTDYDVVICLKISTFVVSITTGLRARVYPDSCDLLENIYLCGINNNKMKCQRVPYHVVICLKISTFVVSITTAADFNGWRECCDLLENIYLCGINNNTF